MAQRRTSAHTCCVAWAMLGPMPTPRPLTTPERLAKPGLVSAQEP
jgi:hypothetical protein